VFTSLNSRKLLRFTSASNFDDIIGLTTQIWSNGLLISDHNVIYFFFICIMFLRPNITSEIVRQISWWL